MTANKDSGRAAVFCIAARRRSRGAPYWHGVFARGQKRRSVRKAGHDMDEAAADRAARRMTAGRRGNMIVAGGELEIAKGQIALDNERFFVRVMGMRVVDRARRHADQ